MFGIILWTDKKNRSGIIWCEDQLQLAYFGNDARASDGRVLETGDFVRLEVQDRNGVRHAHNVMHLGQAANSDALGDRLKRAARPAPVAVPARLRKIAI